MRVTQYRIKGHTWSDYDRISMVIKCEKADINTILKRLKAKNKLLPKRLNIIIVDKDNAKLEFYGFAKEWQEIEDIFPTIADTLDNAHETEREIIDPSLIFERKHKNIEIFNGKQYVYDRYLGILRIYLN